MKTISLKDNNLIIKIPYDIGLVNLIKTSFSPRFWDSNLKVWKAPINGKNVLATYSLTTYHQFIVSPEAIQEIEKYKNIFDEQKKVAEVKIAASKAIEANIEIPNLKGELYPFQKAGVQFIENTIYRHWTPENEISEINDFDIGIMPLVNDEWSSGKCGAKLLQYMAAGIPAVVSPVGVNKEIIQELLGFLSYLSC